MELRAAISASRLMRGKSGKQNRHRNKRLGASQVSFWEISGNEEKLLDKIDQGPQWWTRKRGR